MALGPGSTGGWRGRGPPGEEDGREDGCIPAPSRAGKGEPPPLPPLSRLPGPVWPGPSQNPGCSAGDGLCCPPRRGTRSPSLTPDPAAPRQALAQDHPPALSTWALPRSVLALTLTQSRFPVVSRGPKSHPEGAPASPPGQKLGLGPCARSARVCQVDGWTGKSLTDLASGCGRVRGDGLAVGGGDVGAAESPGRQTALRVQGAECSLWEGRAAVSTRGVEGGGGGGGRGPSLWKVGKEACLPEPGSRTLSACGFLSGQEGGESPRPGLSHPVRWRAWPVAPAWAGGGRGGGAPWAGKWLPAWAVWRPWGRSRGRPGSRAGAAGGWGRESHQRPPVWTHACACLSVPGNPRGSRSPWARGRRMMSRLLRVPWGLAASTQPRGIASQGALPRAGPGPHLDLAASVHSGHPGVMEQARHHWLGSLPGLPGPWPGPPDHL